MKKAKATKNRPPSEMWAVIIPMLASLIVTTWANTLHPTLPIIRDALGYTTTAQRLLLSGELSWGGLAASGEPNAIVTPGYVLVLAAVYWLRGGGPART